MKNGTNRGILLSSPAISYQTVFDFERLTARRKRKSFCTPRLPFTLLGYISTAIGREGKKVGCVCALTSTMNFVSPSTNYTN